MIDIQLEDVFICWVFGHRVLCKLKLCIRIREDKWTQSVTSASYQNNLDLMEVPLRKYKSNAEKLNCNQRMIYLLWL